MASSGTKTLVLLHTAVFLAGWTGIFGRLISLGGLPLVWYRIMVSIIALAAVLGVMGRLRRLPSMAFAKIAGCGGLLALHWVAFYASIQSSNVSIGVACIATSCFFTTILDPLINRKRMSWMEVLISFIAISGVLLIFSLDIRYRLGIALGLLSAALYSLFAILNINVARETGQDSATMLLYELIGGVILLSALVPFLPKADIIPQRNDILWLVLLGSVFTVLPFLFQLQALRSLSAFTVNLAYNLEPVYSIAFAALLFGELREVNFSFWLGVALIIISVLIQTYRVKNRRNKVPSGL
ncbi:MAG: DMT family transporter [Bacteroidales bacterium]|nr:DMT family transporter [Bacteroidales bacterium]